MMLSRIRQLLGEAASRTGFSEPRASAYRRLWALLVGVTLAFSIIPLSITAIASYSYYANAIRSEARRDVEQLTSNAQYSLEGFVQQATAGLRLIAHDMTLEELSDEAVIARVLRNLRKSLGSYVDLGLITSAGIQQSYVGPYNLKGKNYADQDWFHEIQFRDAYFSDVFIGYRNIPHFAVAVKHETDDGRFYIVRATFDTEALTQQVAPLRIGPATDVFITNRSGVLQTPSRLGRNILDPSPAPCPPYSASAELQEGFDASGRPYILGYAYIRDSPFVLMTLRRPDAVLAHLAAFRNKVVEVVVSTTVVIALIVLWGSTYLVRRIRASELARSKALREMEYASKMATIGRLAAGVAHEINNPLAIINEKAGLLKDYHLGRSDPASEKVTGLADSILASVARCSAVTHRLLGFAKRMDVSRERIQMDALLDEVLGFLGKESIYRNITISRHFPEQPLIVESDRGQLQQVFLNVISNALEAVDDGGRIDLFIEQPDEGTIAVAIADNGRGIAQEDLERIFEPFYTTKKIGGTGLGLSITYGIVERLGGHITAASAAGQGTRFTITLPVRNNGLTGGNHGRVAGPAGG